jgi:very-short-patch-repair endonuclease
LNSTVAQHFEQVAKDEWRTRLLAKHHFRVLRFWNDEVLTNLEGVLTKILQELQASGIISKTQAG